MKLKELIGVLPETPNEEIILVINGVTVVCMPCFLRMLSDESLDATVQKVNASDGKIAIGAEIEDGPKNEAREAESCGEGNIACDNCMYTELSEKEYPCSKCRNAYTLKYVPRGDV